MYYVHVFSLGNTSLHLVWIMNVAWLPKSLRPNAPNRPDLSPRESGDLESANRHADGIQRRRRGILRAITLGIGHVAKIFPQPFLSLFCYLFAYTGIPVSLELLIIKAMLRQLGPEMVREVGHSSAPTSPSLPFQLSIDLSILPAWILTSEPLTVLCFMHTLSYWRRFTHRTPKAASTRGSIDIGSPHLQFVQTLAFGTKAMGTLFDIWGFFNCSTSYVPFSTPTWTVGTHSTTQGPDLGMHHQINHNLAYLYLSHSHF